MGKGPPAPCRLGAGGPASWELAVRVQPYNHRTRELRTYLLLVLLLSAPFYALLFVRPALFRSHLFMYMPALAAVATCVIHRRPLRDLGFRFGRWRDYGVACAVPILFGLPVYLVTWLSGLGKFDISPLVRHPWLALLMLAAPLGMVTTIGEELGWSGMLTPRLLEITSFGRASFYRGLIWSLWHYPLVIVLLPRYRPELPLAYALTCMTITVTAISYVYTWLRIDSGSVWPAALLHAVSSNMQDACEGLTRDTGHTHFITYEYGAGFAIVLPIIAVIVWWKHGKRIRV